MNLCINVTDRAIFDRVKKVNQKGKDLVNGYLRKFGQNNIPFLINILCMNYYYDTDFQKWFKEERGRHIVFLDDHRVTKDVEDFGWGTCIYGSQAITSDICNTFEITYKLNAFGVGKAYCCFVIGFVTDKIENSIANWNERIGGGSNEKGSIGVWFYDHDVYVYDRDKSAQQLDHKKQYALNDLFRFKVDFRANQLHLFHNEKEISVIKLNTKYVRPALTISYEKEELEIVAFEMK